MLITSDNYYSAEADREYMSVSQFKAFEACEAAALAKLRGEYRPPVTTALLVGSYVDSWFEGTLGTFAAEHPEIFKRDGSLKADYERAAAMITRCQNDPLFMEYMDGEKQVIRTGELFGVPWKIKIDVLHKDKIVDLKTARSLERIMGRSLVEHYRYDIQGAVYRAIEGNGLPFYLAIVTKEDPPDIEICEIELPDLREALAYVEQQLPRIMAVKRGETPPRRCGKCAYCRSTKTLTKPIPSGELGLSDIEREIGGLI